MATFELAEEEGFLNFLRDRCDDLRRHSARRRARESGKLAALTEVLAETQAGIHEKEGHDFKDVDDIDFSKSHNVLGIAPVAIIDRQLPFEYTIASRSTDVMVNGMQYDAHNEVACLMLGSMTPELHRQFENSLPYEMLQELKSMFKNQAGVERQVGELHAMLIEYEKGLPKKAETPQVMMIKGGKIQKANKKSLKAKGKGKANGKGKTLRILLNSTQLRMTPATTARSRRAVELEEIHDEDTSPSEITSEIPMDVEGFEPPQEEEAPVRRSERPHRTPNRLYLNVEVDEHNNQVWRLVDLPPNGKTVGSKWLFKKKTNIDGNVHTYKARLVAKGFTQTYRVDYEETFSPVADIRAIRILIAIATFYDYEIWQMDVKTVFLNGYLSEDVYMVQPGGFIDPKHPRKDSGRNVTFLILYVDDIIIMGNHIPSLQSVKAYLGKCFAMKDLWEATIILGIKIYRDRSRRLIGLCQSSYMDKILKRYRMDNSKCGHIPMQERLDLNKTQGASTPKEVKRMQNVPYASANPGELYWTAVKNILKYLRNTKDMFLVYGGNSKAELRVDCYCDAGFETDIGDMKSQTGNLNNIAASEAEVEVVWIRKFISTLCIVPTINEPIRMFCDNSAALHFANESGVQMGARHYHRSNLLKVHTDNNLAYPLTKALPKGKLTQHAKSMGLRLASSFM
ncbi:retrotransposon protein, putative, ty1-copia subclass [Tanacetum coccineum]